MERFAVAIIDVFDRVWINHHPLRSQPICQFATHRHFRRVGKISEVVASLAN
jgi:hypothetical protein